MAYSLGNQSFTRLWDEMQMQFRLAVFTGNKFNLFNCVVKELGGDVDFDGFRVNPVISAEVISE